MPPPPPGNFEILDSRRHIIVYFEVYFYFALLLLEVNQFENLDEKKKTERLLKLIPEQCTIYQLFNHRNLALSMFSSTVQKNRYPLISFVLTLEQNMLVITTSWELLSIHPTFQFPVNFS